MPTEIEPQIKSQLPFTECVSHGDGRHDSGESSRQMAKRLQELIEQIQNQPNPASRALLQECLQSLLSFYGDGLTRIIEQLREAGPTGKGILASLVKDKAVSGLLLIHGLHPIDLETRLRQAIETVRPYMLSHGGNVELVGLENDFARLRLAGTCKTCPASTVTLELAVRRAVEEACPDLVGFEVEATAEPETAVAKNGK